MKVSAQLKLMRQILQDPNADRWERDSLLEFLNLAQESMYREIVEADESYFIAIQEYSVTPALNDSLEFDLPSDCSKVKTVERLTSGAPLPGAQVEFQNRNIGGINQSFSVLYTTGPVYYLRDDQIGIVGPSTSYTLRLYYIKTPTDLDDLTDTSEIPVEHHRLMALYAGKLAMGTEGESLEPSLLQEFERMYQQFKTFLDGRKSQWPRYVNYIGD